MSDFTDSLRVLIGDENADKIVDMYGGELIYVPKKPTDNTDRNAHILKLRERKITIRVISETLSISERAVYKILNKIALPCEAK